jgi:hypothetical protein
MKTGTELYFVGDLNDLHMLGITEDIRGSIGILDYVFSDGYAKVSFSIKSLMSVGGEVKCEFDIPMYLLKERL